MSTKIYNLSQNSNPIPGPSFYYKRDKEGKTIGRHTFTVVRGALGLGGVQARFKKGTPITALDTTLSAFFSHLLVVDHESQDLPGGYSEVTVNCEGFTEDGEFETDREVSYSSQTQAVEKSILLNPRYLKDVPLPQDRQAFRDMLNGYAHGEVRGARNEEGLPTEVGVVDMRTDSETSVLTDQTVIRWWVLIFEKNLLTYEEPAFEWRKETTNAGGLTEAQLGALGKRESNPPGDAPHPPLPEGADAGDYSWFKTTASDIRGESSASTEETWQWGYWPALAYADA